MLTVNKLLPQGQGLAAVLLKRAASVELDWDTRQKSRFEASDSQGRRLGVFLPRGAVVRGGDVLVAEDGSLIRVQAAAQPVLVVTACSQHGSPFDLARAAYHLGNRHVQLELAPDHLKLEPDHVLADMLRAMHLTVNEARAAFEPEGGAYASAGHGHHGHSHAGDHDHAHAHGHGHHDHGQAAAHAHSHDAACCGHDHGHHAHGHEHHEAHAHARAGAYSEGAAPAAAAPRRIAIPVLAAQPHVHQADGSCCGHDHAGHDHAGHDHVHQRQVAAAAAAAGSTASLPDHDHAHHHHHHHGDAAPGNDRPLAHGSRP